MRSFESSDKINNFKCTYIFWFKMFINGGSFFVNIMFISFLWGFVRLLFMKKCMKPRRKIKDKVAKLGKRKCNRSTIEFLTKRVI